MKIFRASLADAYVVHKMYLEFLEDTGQSIDPKIRKDLSMWIDKFSPENFFCIVATHCKKSVGMSWGLTGNKLTLEGIFVRRSFRTRLKAIRKLVEGMNALISETKPIAICSVVPENQVKKTLRKGFKISGVLIEKRLGEKWPMQHKRV